MRKLFIFVILFCTNFSTKAQIRSVDSMTSEVIKYIEASTQKKFFSYPKDSLDTLKTSMIFSNPIDTNFFYIFSVKKVNKIFILISINKRDNKKNNESYIFEKNKFFYNKKYSLVEINEKDLLIEINQKDFLVEINQKYFLEKMEEFFHFIKGQIDR